MTDKRLRELVALKDRITALNEMIRTIEGYSGRIWARVFKLVFPKRRPVYLIFAYGADQCEMSLTQDILDALEVVLKEKRDELTTQYQQEE